VASKSDIAVTSPGTTDFTHTLPVALDCARSWQARPWFKAESF
jgi:hypothetical protein